MQNWWSSLHGACLLHGRWSPILLLWLFSRLNMLYIYLYNIYIYIPSTSKYRQEPNQQKNIRNNNVFDDLARTCVRIHLKTIANILKVKWLQLVTIGLRQKLFCPYSSFGKTKRSGHTSKKMILSSQRICSNQWICIYVYICMP